MQENGEMTLLEAINEAYQNSGFKRRDNIGLYQRIHAARTQAKKGLLGAVRASEILEILAPGQYQVMRPCARKK